MKVTIGNQLVEAEVDTGCPIVLIGFNTYKSKFNNIKLTKQTETFRDASGNKMDMVGTFMSTIKGNNNSGVVKIYVQAQQRVYALLGGGALNILVPDWQSKFNISNIDSNSFISLIKDKFHNICDSDYSKPITGVIVDLKLKAGACPVLGRSREMPFAIRDRVNQHLELLIAKGVLERVQESRWASPVVIVPKPNGEIRICIDPKRTLNPFLEDNIYPIPRIDNIFAEIGRGKFYAVVDLAGAFQQLELSEGSRELVTITTPLGLFSYKRMPFGIKVAPAIFQSAIDRIIRKFPWCRAYIDDIILSAESAEQLRDRLLQLFATLKEFNVKINLEKCQFFKREIRFLGHRISHEGIFPCQDKVKEILNAVAPSSVKELQTFIGIVTYLCNYIPQFSTVMSPLNYLLRKDIKYKWGPDQQKAFDEIKEELKKGRFLIHFDMDKRPILCTDASDIGIAAVLCHEEDGMYKPVWFASRTLSSAEKNYPILHREFLAVVFGCEKFYKYIYGQKTLVVTDHKPLLGVVRNGNTLFTANNRVQRYLIRMNPYDVELIYRPGIFNALADFPSRNPDVEALPSEEDLQEESFATIINCVTDDKRLNLQRIKEETQKDSLLIKLTDAIKNSKPFSDELKPFSAMKDQLNVASGLITVDGRILIPTTLHSQVLNVLHEVHIGVIRMKRLARRYFYWPNLNKAIEDKARACPVCQEHNPDRLGKVYIPWPLPSRPYERVHLDFFYVAQKNFLLVVDAFSKWVEIVPMNSTTASQVIMALRKIFSMFGDPDTLVSDNGPPFGSTEFKEFCVDAGIRLLHSPPYHPQSNGIAERWVQTVKQSIKKEIGEKFSEEGLYKILLSLRNTPSVDDLVPSEAILKFKPNTTLEKMIKENDVEEKNIELPAHRVFTVGQSVLIAGVKGTITEVLGNVLYRVLLTSGVSRTAHSNQIKLIDENSTGLRRSKRTIKKPDKFLN